MRKLFFAILGLLVLAVTAVLGLPYLVDWNTHKPLILAELRDLTGRDVEIAGDLRLSLLPTPRVSVEGLKLASLAGGSAPAMLEIGTARVEVALLPLLSRQLQVRRVTLLHPRLLLEVVPDGRRNWDFPAPAETAASPTALGSTAGDAASEGRGLGIRLDRVDLRDGILIYRDLAAGLDVTVEQIDAQFSARSLRGPFALDGTALARNLPVKFSLNLGELNGGVPLGLVVELPALGGARARFSGALGFGAQDGGAAVTGNGRVEVGGGNFGEMLRLVAPRFTPPPNLAGDFRATADVDLAEDRISARNLDLFAASISASGEAALQLGETPDLRLDLVVPRLDLDGLLAPSGGFETAPTERGAAAPTPPGRAQAPLGPAQAPLDQAQAPGPGTGFALPAGLAGSLDLRVSALIFRGQVVRQTAISARLEEGEIAVSQMRALLPGGAELDGTGRLRAKDGAPLFAGRLNASADNLRGVFDWLDIDVSRIPADRLRRLALSAALEVTPRQALFSAIDAELDTSRIGGGVAVALRERIGLGIGLTVDRLNLDGYLPHAAAPVPGGVQSEAAAAGTAPAGAGATEAGAAGAGAAGAGPLDSFDANLDLRIGEVMLHNQAARDIHLDATLQNAVLQLRALTAEDLAGARGRIAGVFYGLPAAPRVEDGAFELKVLDALRFARFVGQPTDGALHRLGPFTASGSVEGRLEDFSYNLDLLAMGGSLLSSGSLSGLSTGGFSATALRLEQGRIELADLAGARLAAFLKLPEDGVLARLGPLGVSSQLSGDLTKLAYDTTLMLGGGRFAFQGVTEDLDSGFPEVDFAADIAHPDLPAFVEFITGATPLPPGIGDLALKTRVTGTPLRFVLSAIDGRIGQTTLGGKSEIAMTGARPKIVAELALGSLPLKPFFRPRETAEGGSGSSGGGQQLGAPGDGQTERWSRKPFDLSAFMTLDADLTLSIAQASYEELEVRDADLLLSLEAGTVQVPRLSGHLAGGGLLASGRFDSAAETPEGAMELALTKVDLRPLLEAVADFERLSGPVTVKSSLTASGNSEAAMVRSLDGLVTLVGDPRLEVGDKARVGGALLGVLGDKLGGKLGDKLENKLGRGSVEQLAGAGNLLGLLSEAFLDEPARLSGSLQLREGVGRTQDARLDGKGATARFRGTVADLLAWTTDLAIDLVREGERKPYLEAFLTGALDQPYFRLAKLPPDPSRQTQPQPGADLPQTLPQETLPQESLPQKTLPPGSEPPVSQSGPNSSQERQPADAKDQLKETGRQLLRNLLKGLPN